VGARQEWRLDHHPCRHAAYCRWSTVLSFPCINHELCHHTDDVTLQVEYGPLVSIQKSSLEDAIGSHAFSPLEALPCVQPMSFLWSVRCLLPVGAVNRVRTNKALLPLGGVEETAGYKGYARCSGLNRIVHSRMPLSFTPLLRLKREHACDQ
jgi:hypothetical protein